MQLFFAPLLFLPVIEIIGFVTIGGKIGVLATLLWLACSTLLGFYLLGLGGSVAFGRVRAGSDEVFLLADAFDGLCLLIAALLLIFPGFISDFIAIPFLLAPVRHWLFGQVQRRPDGMLRRGYRTWAARTERRTTVIEGEYRRMDERRE